MGDESAADMGSPAPEPSASPAPEPEAASSAMPEGEAATSPEPGGEQQPEGGKQTQRMASLQRRLLEQERYNKKLQKQMQELSSKAELADRFEKDPWNALQERGVKLDEWVTRELQGSQRSPEEEEAEALKQQIEELRTWKQEQESQRQQWQTQQQRQQQSQMVRQAISEREDLAYTAKLGQSDMVLDRIQEYHREYGECPPKEQERIAAQVEREMRQSVQASLKALIAVPDFRHIVAEALKQASGEETTDEPDQRASEGRGRSGQQRPRASTLTNQQSATVGGRRGAESRTPEERRLAALRRMGGL